MTDWTSALHSLAGAILGAGAALTGQLIVARNMRVSTRAAAHNEHQKWSRDLAAGAHDGFIVEFERLTPFYTPIDVPMEEDWLTGVHLKLQRMRLVCSTDSYQLAHRAMQALERYRTTPGVPWEPAQSAFDEYLAAARRDLGLVKHQSDPPLTRRVLEHAHIHTHHGEPAVAVTTKPELGQTPPPNHSGTPEPFVAVLAPHPLGPAPATAKVTYSYPALTESAPIEMAVLPE